MDHLGPSGPYGLLAFADLFIVAALVVAGVVPASWAVPFGIIIYGMFGFFSGRHDNAQIRLKELEVEQTREDIKAMALSVSSDLLHRNQADALQVHASQASIHVNTASQAPRVGGESKVGGKNA